MEEEVKKIEIIEDIDEKEEDIKLIAVKNWIDGETYYMTEEEAEIYYKNVM